MYAYPYYRYPIVPVVGWGYPYGGGGAGGYGYGGYGYGYGGNNVIGSAISNQGITNTGIMAGVSQSSNPTVIW
jgi:hypothetical protein